MLQRTKVPRMRQHVAEPRSASLSLLDLQLEFGPGVWGGGVLQ